MTDTNPTPEDGDEVQPVNEGSEATASGPASQVDPESPETTDDELTVEDILNATQAEGLEDELDNERAADAEPEHEHLVDLKRLSAEYANYRKRTEANREVERERMTGDVVKALLPVLDDLDRAEKHGDLEGDTPFSAIAAKLRTSVAKLGLAPFGAKGEPFDHNLHEAIFQQPSPDVEVETILDVVETGYTVGSTLLRAAKVVVAVPAE
ncbi:molecular chaperone GrpE [Okibacterium sp. HSC-33S16]|uniref:nucleotide exchange factor GrpE n=1 Tax=Okibacterium sp. HSC-33S16 TaxID=2910965 RepID=UPI00209EFFF0|nr:nucleotide exchange factor GrpE [Okibacterium sp. HSC-33S16]MCP2031339.1 molecular chaperone GrpE [Okibacterium sp. HSC-33S16]